MRRGGAIDDPTDRGQQMRLRDGDAIAVAARSLGALALVLALAGCGSDAPGTVTSGQSTSTSSSSSGMPVPGGGLSVAEALATDAAPPLAVRGWVVGSGAHARLCSGYQAAASDPCQEPSLALEGDDGLSEGTAVSLLGAVEGDTFVVSSTAQG